MPPPTFSWWQALYLLLFFLLHSPDLHEAAPSIITQLHNGSSACHEACGSIRIKYPFGSGLGCGHPDFASYIRCNTAAGRVEFTTGRGSNIYGVSSIDYSTNTLTIEDPFMSTCSSMGMSGSFTLERGSPFTILPDNVFVLLGCSTTSPVFDKNQDLCNTGSGTKLCRGLYSCKGVTGIGFEPNSAPISTCCVYEPPSQIGVGGGYGLDLPKLQCSSYTSIYGYGGDEGDPMRWQYGVSLQYNDSSSYYTDECKNCEDSGGFCGFSSSGAVDHRPTFVCVCKNGVNTTINCYGRGYAWSGTWRQKIQRWICFGGFLLLFVVLLI